MEHCAIIYSLYSFLRPEIRVMDELVLLPILPIRANQRKFLGTGAPSEDHGQQTDFSQ